jgi:hypothetical protein
VLALTILDPALATSKGTADKDRKSARRDSIDEEEGRARDKMKAHSLRAEMLLQETLESLPKIGIESPTGQDFISVRFCYAYHDKTGMASDLRCSRGARVLLINILPEESFAGIAPFMGPHAR